MPSILAESKVILGRKLYMDKIKLKKRVCTTMVVASALASLMMSPVNAASAYACSTGATASCTGTNAHAVVELSFSSYGKSRSGRTDQGSVSVTISTSEFGESSALSSSARAWVGDDLVASDSYNC